MVRKGDYKLIYYPQSDTYLMFDVVSDPAETKDLIDQPEMQEKVVDLKTELTKLMEKMDDPMLAEQEN